ncbi:DUF7689 domain-containing protein [Phytohabitans rumicis]|uniref:DUF7689 domain-containing protein n=1 Tax=Phytohabitans rumicis TaxID=1076125 RepID=A0A6V8L9C1_9ACTN|nr:hypothetical protein [Phytohabitans rumicis]GFJ93832.1 hypothetical protein Prum_074740 [Phytohabitans rumicis]
MARPPNEYEWRELARRFPGLVWHDVEITDEPTRQYNCIGYSMGLRQWINPDSPLTAFEQQYGTEGFVVAPADTASVDGWGKDDGAEMTHGSRQSTTRPQTGLWESKLGRWFRITHGRDQLVGTRYGTVLTHFLPSFARGEETEGVSMPEYGDDELRQIAEQSGRVDPGLKAAFDERLTAWKATWDGPELLTSENTYDFATGPEFEAVVGLGDGIVPLIIEEMTQPDGFFLVPLLEQYRDPVPPGAPAESEQSRRDRAIRAWLASL